MLCRFGLRTGNGHRRRLHLPREILRIARRTGTVTTITQDKLKQINTNQDKSRQIETNRDVVTYGHNYW